MAGLMADQSKSAGELNKLSEEETALRTVVGSKRKNELTFVVGRVKIPLSSHVCPPRGPTKVQ